MARSLPLRIIIADGEHARFVQPDPDHACAHLCSCDIGSDRPGRAFQSGANARHAVGSGTIPHTMEKEKFVRLLGELINAAPGRGEFDELLVAPPRGGPPLGDLREALDAATQAKLVGALEQDLVKTPVHGCGHMCAIGSARRVARSPDLRHVAC